MTINNNESVIPGIDMDSLLNSTIREEKSKETVLEKKISEVTPEDAAATKQSEVKFQFRSLLDEDQQKALQLSAPKVATQMIKNYSTIVNFGAPVLQKLNESSIMLLNEQKNIKIPEADQVVSNLLREIDGYQAKYRNEKLEDFVGKLKKLFKGTNYSLKSMVRDAQPISKRLDEVETKIRSMELDLENNNIRARKLHEQTLETMKEVVAVLAALEEIANVVRTDYNEVNKLIEDNGGDETAVVTYKGQKYSVSELREIHTDLAEGLSEIEKSWFDWRQQFFLGYASTPSLRNLILVSSSMQRRLQVFRTQGVPSARRSLAMWQQAALAKESAQLSDSLQKGTNDLIQSSFGATAEAVEKVAYASQAPVITEETIFSIIHSVKNQAQALVDADKWGRDMRSKNLDAIETGEKAIKDTTIDSRRQIVMNAVRDASKGSITGTVSEDIFTDMLGKDSE